MEDVLWGLAAPLGPRGHAFWGKRITRSFQIRVALLQHKPAFVLTSQASGSSVWLWHRVLAVV